MSHPLEVQSSHLSPSESSTVPSSHQENEILPCLRSLVQLEQSLTQTLSNTKPLLSLPTPKTMSQAQTILALARTYSTRTSAPPGWDPSLPVAHFATPSPYPHQLRGGSLGALQLKLVREERMMKKRKIMEEEKLKREQIMEKSKRRKSGDLSHLSKEEIEKRRKIQLQKQQQVSMNLSSSSSSEEEEDSEGDE